MEREPVTNKWYCKQSKICLLEYPKISKKKKKKKKKRKRKEKSNAGGVIVRNGTIYQPLRSGRIWHKVNF